MGLSGSAANAGSQSLTAGIKYATVFESQINLKSIYSINFKGEA